MSNLTSKPDEQDRGLWVAAVLWGVPFAACVVVVAWGLYVHGRQGLGIRLITAIGGYFFFELAGYLYRRRRSRGTPGEN